ncbi:flagellar basal body-associated FliL family protein [Desulfohalobiaceae bacterium Ax17]|uniref:flagellar basal body-associated FliL family protein n=1 Tax=Desulfovulcanus ferrireducens TaxID=2831190 RepID=UPI00207BCBB0|nr:flagellar basal body-associated FliL family protein [Desulfovulcanus ferrireducens]MBT8764405.1 flagellar basal body-associated FliL family protein [Desulfovulcanus ferrireducens]
MLFIVPDPEESNQNNTEEKVKLDTSELTIDKGTQKVELDLDDAPFLEEEKEGEEEEKKDEKKEVSVESEEKPEDQVPVPTPFWKKKWFFIALAGVIALIAVGAYFLFLKPSPPPPPEPQKPQVQKAEPSPPPPPPPEEIVIPFEPFWVELTFNGQTKFLYCKLSFSTTDSKLEWEVKRKTIILRDAVYYYLRNKNFIFLNNKKNVERLKEDILSVVNQYLNNGQLKKILIEEYVLK